MSTCVFLSFVVVTPEPCQTDNFCREGKNQVMAKFSASAIIWHKTLSMSEKYEFARLDCCLHLHHMSPAFILTVNTHKKRIQDFVDIIKAKVTPCRKRELRAEVLKGAHDWKSYFEQYHIEVHGLVPNPHAKIDNQRIEMNVNHCWRFVQRGEPINC